MSRETIVTGLLAVFIFVLFGEALLCKASEAEPSRIEQQPLKSIKLNLFSSLGREESRYFDIEKHVKKVLSSLNLSVVEEDATPTDASMFVSYIEKAKGAEADVRYSVYLYDNHTNRLLLKENFQGTVKMGVSEFKLKYSFYLPFDLALALALKKQDYIASSIAKNILIIKSYSEVYKFLKELNSPDLVNILIQNLKSDDDQVRVQAARALSQMGSREATLPIIDLLSDEKDYVREKAATSLGKIGDKSAVDALIKVLDDRTIRNYSVRALAEIGDTSAIESILKDLEYKRWGYKIEACKTLYKLGEEKGIEILLDFTQDMDKNARERSIEALGNIGGEKAVTRLLELLKSDYTKKEAKDTLHDHIKEAENLNPEIFLEALDESFPLTYVFTLQVFAKKNDPRAHDILKKALTFEDEDILRGALYAFSGSSDCKVAPLIIKVLKNSSRHHVRLTASQVLYGFDCPGVQEALIKALNDKDSSIRRYAGISLAQIGGEQAIKALVSALDKRKEAITAEAFTHCNDTQNLTLAVHSLIKAAQNTRSKAMVKAALETLGKTGDVRAVKPLLSMLERWFYKQNADVMIKVVCALGDIGDSSALETLMEIFYNRELGPGLRSAAIYSVSKILSGGGKD